MDTLQQTLILVGLSGFATLWIGATIGVLHIAWDTIITPIVNRLSDR